MGQLTIKYGSNEIAWSEVASIQASSSGELSVTTTDNQNISLRLFSTYQDAENARLHVLGRAEYADGNGEVIVTVDDL